MTDTQETPPQETDPATDGDDRKTDVNPAENPAPSNPPADDDKIHEAEEQLDRIVPG